MAVPVVEGPISGGAGRPFIVSTEFDLTEVGYELAEYFISGTATAFTSADPLSEDGEWNSVGADVTAPYKTRLLVHRPIDPERFNGTVIVEWLNVTRCLDFAPDWINAHTELTRSGFAWVGVSVQRMGIDGQGPLEAYCPPTRMPLKTADPERYDSLVHPGDSFAYDIFSQAAQAIRRPDGNNPLGLLHAARVIGAGQSQSGFRLVTYVDAIHPLADIFDGYLIHGRAGTAGAALGAMSLAEAPQVPVTPPGSARIRGDLNVPVLVLLPENFLVESLFDAAAARQGDTDRFRLWEIPGASDGDTYLFITGLEDRGDPPRGADLVVTDRLRDQFDNTIICNAPLNSGPHHYLVNAAMAALDRWVRDATPPPTADRIELVDGQVQRDALGNALGGIRTPQLDVPIATLSGAQSGGMFECVNFGTTQPFDAAQLRLLYADHNTFVDQFNAATDRAVAAGFILPLDAALMKAAAAQSDVGS